MQITQEDRDDLLKLGELWLGFYAPYLRDGLDALIENRSGWHTGYDDMNDLYWCRPSTIEGHTIPGPFIAFKWDSRSFEKLRR